MLPIPKKYPYFLRNIRSQVYTISYPESIFPDVIFFHHYMTLFKKYYSFRNNTLNKPNKLHKCPSKNISTSRINHGNVRSM